MAESKEPVKVEDLAMCGIDCKECNVYQFTVNGKKDNYDEMVKGWTEHAKQYWRMNTLDPALIRCKGCRYEGEGKFLAPRFCPIRRCIIGHKISSCAYCAEIKGCQRAYPEGIENLEKMRFIKLT